MEVYLTESNKYHEVITTDKETANMIYKLHSETATIIAYHYKDTFYYSISWLKGVDNIDDNLSI